MACVPKILFNFEARSSSPPVHSDHLYDFYRRIFILILIGFRSS